MKKLTPLVLLSFLLASCNFKSEKFITTKKYSGEAKLKNIYVIVADDKDTKEWLTDYKNAFMDSLKSYQIDVEGISYCCDNKKPELKDALNVALSSSKKFQNILMVSVFKTNTGYSTAVTRYLHLELYDIGKSKKVWNSTVATTLNWFTSGQDLKDAAERLSYTTLAEMKNKAIL